MKIIKRLLPGNLLLDRFVHAIPFSGMQGLKSCSISRLDLSRRELTLWVERFFPDYRNTFIHPENKKLLEFFVTYTLLQIKPEDVYLDAAGGIFTYAGRVVCRRAILQDIRISSHLKNTIPDDVHLLESDVSRISLPDGAVDKISCHHSFEHFQGSSDIHFLQEIQRILAPGGRCCIIPIFIASRYYEISDRLSIPRRFDPAAKGLFDPTSTLPGGDSCGNFSRVYDLASFQRRIIDTVDTREFATNLVEFTLDGSPVPDFASASHRGIARVNQPYRALIVDRRTARPFRPQEQA